MGQRAKIWAIMASIILLSGMLGFGFSPDALAVSDKGLEKGKANGCGNGTAKNNPHCRITSLCDNAPIDGEITATELANRFGLTLGEAIGRIGLVDSDNSGTINSQEELDGYNAQNPTQLC